MKKLFIIVCLEVLILIGCSPIHYRNSNEMTQKINNDNFLLNEVESAFLNKIFKSTRKDFNFIDKKVAFIEIGGEKGKNCYFDMQKKHANDTKYPCDNGILYIFNSIQKIESGGYDAAIVYWSKFLLPIENVIERLSQTKTK